MVESTDSTTIRRNSALTYSTQTSSLESASTSQTSSNLHNNLYRKSQLNGCSLCFLLYAVHRLKWEKYFLYMYELKNFHEYSYDMCWGMIMNENMSEVGFIRILISSKEQHWNCAGRPRKQMSFSQGFHINHLSIGFLQGNPFIAITWGQWYVCKCVKDRGISTRPFNTSHCKSRETGINSHKRLTQTLK